MEEYGFRPMCLHVKSSSLRAFLRRVTDPVSLSAGIDVVAGRAVFGGASTLRWYFVRLPNGRVSGQSRTGSDAFSPRSSASVVVWLRSVCSIIAAEIRPRAWPAYPGVARWAVARRHVIEQYVDNSIEADHSRPNFHLRPVRGLTTTLRIGDQRRNACILEFSQWPQRPRRRCRFEASVPRRIAELASCNLMRN